MDFGGILSGIGIAADETVRAGRKNKHERQQIELRDALARDREKERYAQSRQDLLLSEKREYRARFELLTAQGYDPTVAAYGAKSDGMYEYITGVGQSIKDLNQKDGGNRSISSAFDVTYKKGQQPDFSAEPERQALFKDPRISEDQVLSQIAKAKDLDELDNLDLPFFIKEREGILKEIDDPEVVMEKLSKQLDLQSMNLKKFTLGTPEYDEALKALNKTQDKYKAASAGLKQSQNFKSLVDGLGKPELDDFRKTIDRVSEGMATDFRTLFTAGTKEGNTFFINLGGEEGRVSLQGNNIHFDQQTGTIQGIEDQQKKERIMNYLREKRIVEERKALQSLAPEQIPYFDQHWNSAGYATLLPEKIFEGAVTMSDNPEVPTESFYQHLQKHKGDYVQYPIMKTIEGTNLRRKVYINVQVTDDYLDEIARKLGSFQSQQQNPFVQ
tara:strand:+ start:631 stop:1959 length:1329 start_codon:yes stop_codon:yes gene_type:complete